LSSRFVHTRHVKCCVAAHPRPVVARVDCTCSFGPGPYFARGGLQAPTLGWLRKRHIGRCRSALGRPRA
jgi:hypothetical protein